jgi:hypothetical protein
MELFTPFTVSIRSTITAVFSRLVPYLYPPANEQTATLDTLPTEILILISDFLPTESQLSLSLVSKAIHSALPIERIRDNCDIDAVRQFLYLLRRDPGLSSMYLCSSCLKFYGYQWNLGFWEIRCPHHTFVASYGVRWVDVKEG